MSTRSVIGEPTETGFRGRYVHGDGQPSHMVPAVLGIIRHHGGWRLYSLAKSKEFLLKPNSWSMLHPAPAECVAHTDGDAFWVTSDGDDSDTEWAYIMEKEHLIVYARIRPAKGKKDAEGLVPKTWLLVGTVNYDFPPTAKEVQDMECGAKLERCKHVAWVHFPEADGTRYSTKVWLGKEKPGMHNATHAIVAGVRYKLTGSGSQGSALTMDYKQPSYRQGPRYWWASAEAGGQSTWLRVAKITGGCYVVEANTQLAFPPTGADAAEHIVAAGARLKH